jgi:RimJ/RimL family protein N-acetyltransferase
MTAAAESLDHLRPWMPWAAGDPPDLQTRLNYLRARRAKFDLGEDFVYGIFNQEETVVLGGTGLHTRAGEDTREIGYWIHKDYINQGYATEVAMALTKVAFEVDQVRRVLIQCVVENIRSAAIPKKLGFTHEATLRQRALLNGRYHDMQLWTLLQDEYPPNMCSQAQVQAYDALNRRIL